MVVAKKHDKIIKRNEGIKVISFVSLRYGCCYKYFFALNTIEI